MRDFETGRGAERREPGPGNAGPEPWLRLLLASLLGVLLGALLVSLLSLSGRFGAVPSYLLTGAAAVGAGCVVGLVAGRREVPVAALSLVAGVLLVAITFTQQAPYGPTGSSISNPLPLLVFGIPLVALVALGGWLAEIARLRGSRRGGRVTGLFAELPPRVLVGIVVAVFAVLGLFMIFAGYLRRDAGRGAGGGLPRRERRGL